MSMVSIRERYGVPAHRGRRIAYCGDPCVITGSSRNEYLMVRFDDDPKRTHPIHPTRGIDWNPKDPDR